MVCSLMNSSVFLEKDRLCAVFVMCSGIGVSDNGGSTTCNIQKACLCCWGERDLVRVSVGFSLDNVWIMTILPFA